MSQDDPEAYRSEVLGEFRSGVSTFFDADALSACVAEGRRWAPPRAGVRYVGITEVRVVSSPPDSTAREVLVSRGDDRGI